MSHLGAVWFGGLLFAISGFGQTPVNFDRDITPIFKSNCTGCHGVSVKMKDLNLSTEETALKGGDSGHAIVPGNPGAGDRLVLH